MKITAEFTEMEVALLNNAMDLLVRQHGTAIMKYNIEGKETSELVIHTASGILKKLNKEPKAAQ